VSDMVYMFEECSRLTSLDLSSFNTSNVTNMSYMFYNCTSLTYITVTQFSTSSVTNSTNMFYGCTNIQGQEGTTYNSNYLDKTYARIDTSTRPGYFWSIGGY
ncbi:MAG: BspA family leucine-rich repeat surface protein, partial [Clostridia bacterium]|nr:BspA family leucine-rich repeat surface protein [Clostridia bacterium]